MTVEMRANRHSDISSALGRAGAFAAPGNKPARLGLPGVGVISGLRVREGRHLLIESTLERQGWIWSGYENMTKTTIAARPIVEAMEGVY